jgi:hypothetical protein
MVCQLSIAMQRHSLSITPRNFKAWVVIDLFHSRRRAYHCRVLQEVCNMATTIDPDINYHLPVVAHHRGERLPATVVRGRKILGGTALRQSIVAHDCKSVRVLITGGFDHLSDEDFLDRVRLVFDFRGGAEFDFVSNNYRPSNLQ